MSGITKHSHETTKKNTTAFLTTTDSQMSSVMLDTFHSARMKGKV